MNQSYSQLYLHLVWSTWDRLPLVTAELEPGVYACIQAGCRELRADVLAIGGSETHVHLLVRIPTTLCAAALAKQVKGASSHLANHELASPHGFKWQGAYSAFSVSKSDVSRVRDYILNQKEHHRTLTLDDELEALGASPSGESAKADLAPL